jgi:hypothetical protein
MLNLKIIIGSTRPGVLPPAFICLMAAREGARA